MAHAEGSAGDSAQPVITRSKFCTDGLPLSEGFAIWQESVSPLFESLPKLREDFYAEVETFHLGALLLGHARCAAQQFRRDRRRRNRDDIDHFFVQLYLGGGYAGQHAGRDIRVRPGDISILNLGMDFLTQAPDFECLNLVVPRDLLLGMLKTGADPSGVVLSGDSAMGRILASHLSTVWQTLPTLPAQESGYVSQSLLGVLAASLGSWENREPAAPLAQGTLDAMRAYIERNLDSPELDPAHLCRAFRCSRSFLYQLFQPEGGVAHYIQQCRLRRCYRELTQPGGRPRRIGDIALRWGFASQSHFGRLFHQTFGMTPKEAAQQARQALYQRLDGGAHPPEEIPHYRQWLVEL